MKSVIFIISVIAAATLVYSVPILDTVEESEYPKPPLKIPFPPFKIPMPPSASYPELQLIHRPPSPVKVQGPPSLYQPIPELAEADSIKHDLREFIGNNLKLDGDYFNGKKVPTPKYQRD